MVIGDNNIMCGGENNIIIGNTNKCGFEGGDTYPNLSDDPSSYTFNEVSKKTSKNILLGSNIIVQNARLISSNSNYSIEEQSNTIVIGNYDTPTLFNQEGTYISGVYNSALDGYEGMVIVTQNGRLVSTLPPDVYRKYFRVNSNYSAWQNAIGNNNFPIVTGSFILWLDDVTSINSQSGHKYKFCISKIYVPDGYLPFFTAKSTFVPWDNYSPAVHAVITKPNLDQSGQYYKFYFRIYNNCDDGTSGPNADIHIMFNLHFVKNVIDSTTVATVIN